MLVQLAIALLALFILHPVNKVLLNSMAALPIQRFVIHLHFYSIYWPQSWLSVQLSILFHLLPSMLKSPLILHQENLHLLRT
jgi:hypothetical protein